MRRMKALSQDKNCWPENLTSQCSREIFALLALRSVLVEGRFYN
jgi:hypothetical protein